MPMILADALRDKRNFHAGRNARSLWAGMAFFCLFFSLASAQDGDMQRTRLQARTDYFRHKIDDSSTEPWLKIPCYDSLVSLYGQLHDRQKQHEVRKEQIAFLKQQGYFSQAIQISQDILALMDTQVLADSLDIVYRSEIQLSLGILLSHAGMYQESVSAFMELLRNPAPGWIHLQAHSYLGYIYMQKGQLEQSMEHHAQARKIFYSLPQDDPGTQAQRGILFNHLASWYYAKAQYDSAIHYLKEVVVKGSPDEEHQKLLLYNNMGLIYMLLDETPIADEYLHQALSLARTQKNAYMETVSLQNIAFLQMQSGQLDKAGKTYLQAISLAQKMDFKDLLSSLMIAYSDILFQTGRYQEFKDYYTAGIEKRDSLSGVMSQIQLDYLTAKYENYKMASDKKMLEQDLHMTNLSNQRRGIVLAIAAFLITSLLIYIANMFKRLRMKNKEVNRLHDYVQKTKLLQEEGIDNLESSIESKNRELAARSLYLVRVNDTLKEVRKEMEKIRSCKSPEEKDLMLQNLEKSLSCFDGNVNGWQDFRFYFEQIHKDFYTQLTSHAPDMSPVEQRLCALLASNLTPKEIAEITNRSPRTIETMIYRIRKKLGLASDVKIPLYLQKFL